MARLVAIRSVLAEGADRAVDDARVARRDGVVADAEALHDTGTEGFDDHVRRVGQFQECVEVLLVLQVERDAALAPRDVTEPDAFAILRHSAHAARRLANT